MVAAKIEVEALKDGEFRVRVIESGTESVHRVTLRAEDYERLTAGKAEPWELVRRSF